MMKHLKILSLSIAITVLFSVILLMSFTATNAQGDAQPTVTPSGYSELLETEIRGFSPDQIDGYRTGKGLGMALPAELNGYPGPRHVLDLAEEIELTSKQLEDIQLLYDGMLPQAVELGEQILTREANLELAFREGAIDEASLQVQLDELGDLYAQLRFVHLSTHLETLDILTQHQVFLYNNLRGYEQTDSAHDSSHNH